MGYSLTTRLEFAAAHRLRGYDGNCARLHGHNWKIEICVTGNQLNEIGMLIDFKELKRRGNALLSELDHFYLNDSPPFDEELNPTAENIAFYLFQRLSKELNNDNMRVKSVTAWETDRSAATFSAD
jgi:6-pyruvoyltetrahydropterin/6-carboxytetrahydropterin synthase